MRMSNEFMVGTLVLLCLVLFTGIILVVGGYSEIFEAKKEVTVIFKDVKGIKVGDPVFYAGVEVGEVSAIKFRPVEKRGEIMTLVEVRCVVNADILIREDSEATVASTLTGVTSLIIKPGVGKIKKESVIEGRPPLEFSELADAGGNVLSKVEKLLNHLNSLFGRLDEKGDVDDAIGNLKNATSELHLLLKEAKGTLKENRKDIRSSVKNVRNITGKVDELIERQSDTVTMTIENLASASKTIEKILREQEDEIKELIVNLNDASLNMSAALGTAKKLFEENRPRIGNVLRDVEVVSANMRNLSNDLKRRPWRLLHKPSRREQAKISVYDLAAMMEEQASLISRALDTLEGMDPDREEYRFAIESLKGYLDRYKSLEKSFLGKLESMETTHENDRKF